VPGTTAAKAFPGEPVAGVPRLYGVTPGRPPRGARLFGGQLETGPGQTGIALRRDRQPPARTGGRSEPGQAVAPRGLPPASARVGGPSRSGVGGTLIHCGLRLRTGGTGFPGFAAASPDVARVMNPAQWFLVGLVRVYQWTLSPLKTAVFGPAGRCRFHPSCSAYAVDAVRRHGAWRGLWLAARRLLRCHPWGDSGPDPVPEAGARDPRSPAPTPRPPGNPAADRSPLRAGCRH
jgi:uncharacterized protein